MRLIVDRIEGDFAVCEKEDLSHENIGLKKLPKGTEEGSVIIKNEDGSYEIDRNEQYLRKQKMLELQKKLFEKK